MSSLATILSPSGRLAPKSFVGAALGVYAAGFLSQLLLNTPVTSRAGIVPFALAQLALGWCWYVLHARRLRDSGRGSAWAIVLTIFYVVPMVLLFWMILTAHDFKIPESDGLAVLGILGVLVFLLLWSLVVGPKAALGTDGFQLVAMLAAIPLSVLIAFIFTLWLASRPSVPPAT